MHDVLVAISPSSACLHPDHNSDCDRGTIVINGALEVLAAPSSMSSASENPTHNRPTWCNHVGCKQAGEHEHVIGGPDIDITADRGAK